MPLHPLPALLPGGIGQRSKGRGLHFLLRLWLHRSRHSKRALLEKSLRHTEFGERDTPHVLGHCRAQGYERITTRGPCRPEIEPERADRIVHECFELYVVARKDAARLALRLPQLGVARRDRLDFERHALNIREHLEYVGRVVYR